MNLEVYLRFYVKMKKVRANMDMVWSTKGFIWNPASGHDVYLGSGNNPIKERNIFERGKSRGKEPREDESEKDFVSERLKKNKGR